VELEDLLRLKTGNGLLVLLDGIEDPHNLGAIVRTSLAAGASGVIIPKRRAGRLDRHRGARFGGRSRALAGGAGEEPRPGDGGNEGSGLLAWWGSTSARRKTIPEWT